MIDSIALRRFWLATGILLVASVVYLSVAPRIDAPDLPGGDKLGHFIAYGTVTLWFMQVAVGGRSRLKVALVLIVLGVGLEFVQSLIPGRSFELGDMAANTIGVALGWLAAPPRTPNVLAAVSAAVARRSQ